MYQNRICQASILGGLFTDDDYGKSIDDRTIRHTYPGRGSSLQQTKSNQLYPIHRHGINSDLPTSMNTIQIQRNV